VLYAQNYYLRVTSIDLRFQAVVLKLIVKTLNIKTFVVSEAPHICLTVGTVDVEAAALSTLW